MSKEPPPAPVRLGLVRMSDASATMIGMVAERFAPNEFVVSTGETPEIIVVDADRVFRSETLGALRDTHAGLPLIVLSSSIDSFGDALILRKPISVQDLLDALRAARARIGQPQVTAPDGAAADDTPPRGGGAPLAAGMESADDCCGDAEDIPPDAPRVGAEHARAHFDDGAGLLGTLRKVARQGADKGRILSIVGLADVLYVDGTTANRVPEVITNLDDDALQTAAADQSAGALQVVSLAAVPQSARGWRRLPLETLLWKVALWSARGRLPDNLSAHGRIKLSSWPNFTRLTATPHALRIAAVWVTRYQSPIEIAALLGIRQRYVFSLCSAAQIAGLVEREPAAAPSRSTAAATAPATVKAPVITAPPRGLLRRIIGRLLDAR